MKTDKSAEWATSPYLLSMDQGAWQLNVAKALAEIRAKCPGGNL